MAVLVAAAIAISGTVASAGASGPPLAAPVALIGVNVIPMDDERVLPGQTVLIKDGRISQIGPASAVAIPRGATRIDGRGRYLLPGLADMHAHLSGYVTAPNADKFGIARAEMLLYVATGVTLVRNMAGSPDHLEYRRRVAAGEMLGPRIFTATPVVDGPNPVWPFSIKMTDTADADALVEGFVADVYDQIKVYNELPRAAYAALMDAAAKRGLKVVGHVPFSIGIDGALAAGQYSIEHQRGYDYDGVRPQALLINGGRNAERFSSWQHMSDDRMRDLVRKTVAAGTWNCPTFVVDDMLSNADKRADVARSDLIRYVHPDTRATILSNELDQMFPPDASAAIRASFSQKEKLLKMLSDAGAGLLVGTDTVVPYLVPGFTPIDEMRWFVDAGLTPYQALRAATSVPAQFLGIDSDSGTIAVGKRADLLLVDANPLVDIGNLWRQSGVLLNGRWLARAEILRMLAAQAATFPQAVSGSSK